ncbi:MAG: type III pantothenate kinase, partial [Gemmatimonadetes bacterium]|nr:type III pantothenate kinase [Gemmatimonadota bacterium]NIQ56892.1 type III pantothenate kinase [Gemmatimonadota bacterium]NIU80000.1 type III pantothenate kinase [Gammaproteobacteria bacterium]NIX48445.1 type III pantothenate kinase [Gemmatimonadota bacterium]NIY12879.1 type III pantothenate kinase [Gemmatimonadota bacterium]
MILTLDIGNTETVLGIFDGEELAAHWRLSTRPERTADEYGLLLRSVLRESRLDGGRITGAAIASVVPPLTQPLAEACQRHLDRDPLVIGATSDLPIRLDVEEPLSVGADRIANTLAAARLYAADTIVVDLGTATTFDCITADGVFLGGVIAPGVRTGAETLTRRTARLPRVDIEPPAAVIGRRTDTALQSGIFFGAVEAIDGIVRRIREEWGNTPLVVGTGGLAPFLAPHTRSIDRVEPFLTLHGLRIAWDER